MTKKQIHTNKTEVYSSITTLEITHNRYCDKCIVVTMKSNDMPAENYFLQLSYGKEPKNMEIEYTYHTTNKNPLFYPLIDLCSTNQPKTDSACIILKNMKRWKLDGEILQVD